VSGQQAAAQPSTPAPYPGLLRKLMAVVRPEFRNDRLAFDPADPVFGGALCHVPGCGRTSRVRNLCRWHYLQWSEEKPNVDEFIATARTQWRRYTPPASCQVPGCRYGRRARRVCSRHYHRWKQEGRPELETWLTTATSAEAQNPPPTCRIAYCDLWVHASTPFCHTHAGAWRRHGKPNVEQFTSRYDDETTLNREHIDLRGLGPHLRLELQYVFQCRRDNAQAKVNPGEAQRLINFIAASGVSSLLDRPEQIWRQYLPPADRKSSTAQLLYARRQIEDLAFGRGWDVEYPRDVWRLRNLAINAPIAHLRFGHIAQPWLKELAKRWARWRLTKGLSAGVAARGTRVLARFSAFLASPTANVTSIADVDRSLLERYLADLHAEFGDRKLRGEHIEHLNGFLTVLRQHRWVDNLPASARFFSEDYPKRGERLPRALAEHVMAQVERPDNLDRWDCPAQRLITLILIRCGLRVGDACRLPADCVVHDADGAPYLRYYNHKMKREALVPIDEELLREIAQQRQRVTQRWPQGTPVLFPRPTRNVAGAHPTNGDAYRLGLRRWLQRCDIRDEHARPVTLTPHQWRHTLGTLLINRNVPQHVVQKILDHDSAEMTAHYARLADTTVREHWERARKVNISGETVTYDPDGQLSEAVWAKQRLSRATQALPNGYCGLPLARSCPHANSCLTCPMFLTTADFLPQHRQQHRQTLQIISAAEARSQARMVEMNRQVADNLEKIIKALECDHGTERVSDDAS
jgi:integrase